MHANEMLTPGDVDHKMFNTTRLHIGYRCDEVDEFCNQARDTIRELADTTLAYQAECARLRRIAKQWSLLALNQPEENEEES
ncbi:MAG: DivIVA domain-containing protein [Bifidobacteriaceae bacterium]|jgi:DivIVA domain-containing protein|nr:DivIVA domain-containing protein [Bifidobacteriaceae bacterium]